MSLGLVGYPQIICGAFLPAKASGVPAIISGYVPGVTLLMIVGQVFTILGTTFSAICIAIYGVNKNSKSDRL